jgi:hypothetical protein
MLRVADALPRRAELRPRIQGDRVSMLKAVKLWRPSRNTETRGCALSTGRPQISSHEDQRESEEGTQRRWTRSSSGTARGIAVRGDSVAALSWIERERFSGKLVGNAAMIYVVQAIAWGIRVEQVTHLPAEQNTAADYLSRINEGGRTLEGFRKKFPQFKDAPVVDTKPSGLVPLCDPQLDIGSDAKFTAFWRRAQVVVGERTMGSGVQQASGDDVMTAESASSRFRSARCGEARLAFRRTI